MFKSLALEKDLLLDAGDLQKVFILRKILSSMGTVDAMEFLLDKMKDCKTNEEFFQQYEPIDQSKSNKSSSALS